MSPNHARARFFKRTTRYVHLCAIGLSVFIVWNGHGVGVILLLLALLVDFILFKVKIRDDSIGFLIKIMLLIVCSMLSYSIIFSSHKTTALSQVFPEEHNHIRSRHRAHSSKKTHSNQLRDEHSDNKVESDMKERHNHQSHPSHRLSSKIALRGHISNESDYLINRAFGGWELPKSDFADLRYRPSKEVRTVLKRIFQELPPRGFLEDWKNPCWKADVDVSRILNEREAVALKKRRKTLKRKGIVEEEETLEDTSAEASVHCLPYAYILGQPKCGTSDLFERLKMHPQIKMPARKEVRWFTRGEFTRSRLDMEVALDSADGDSGKGGVHRQQQSIDTDSNIHQLLGPGSSIYSFTKSFHNAVKGIMAHPSTHVTVDGGPHTLWWPTQSPDGSIIEEAIPTPQIIREIQPHAKFIVTLSDPVKRTFSDYYFLDDNQRVHKPGSDGEGAGKNSQHFHERIKEQIESMQLCIAENVEALSKNSPATPSAEEQTAYWFRSSQVCAHDRHKFAVAGWGRLAIGMYAVFLEKWLEHFRPSQFLVVRLEDYDKDPKAYMKRIFTFLGVSDPDFSDWSGILNKHKANEYHAHREAILEETETLLRSFYAPYNKILSTLLDDERFQWTDSSQSLRESQLASEKRSDKVSDADALALSSNERDSDLESRKRKVVSDKMAAAQHAKRNMLMKKWDKHYEHVLYNATEPIHLDLGSESSRADKDSSGEVNRRGRDGHHVNGASRMDPPRKASKDRERGKSGDDDGSDKESSEVTQKKKKHADIISSATSRSRSDDVPAQGTALSGSLHPRAFSLKGLPLPESEEFNLWLRDGKHISRENPPIDEQDAAEQICIAAFALDLAAIKYLLYDVGLPNDLINLKDSNRNAFHCLALVHIMADAHGKSLVFATLKGLQNWMRPYVDPPLPKQSHSVLARDIIDGIGGAVANVAAWLARAGIPLDTPDSGGNTPLHHAAAGGMLELSSFLVEHGANVNKKNREGRTPLHYSCSYGHTAVAGRLVEAGADLDSKDKFGTSPRLIVSVPGPVLPLDAIKYLNITQRSVRKINRMIHPERKPGAKGGWRGGTGGWGTERLKGYEKDMHCDIDQYWAHEIDGDEIFEKYISRMAPVLIRGLMDDWEAIHRYAQKNLTAEHGELRVQVSDIPYSDKFGGSQREDMLLSEYIDEVREHRMAGGNHPWYVFRGNRIPLDSEKTESLVQYSWTPTPHAIQHAIEYLNPPTARGYTGPKSREIFVNAQWAIGGEGTGAPVHYHNTAWNALVYGAKKWFIYPPHSMIMSNKQILDYVETDHNSFADRGVHSLSCVQTAGDIMIIPEIWGHGVLNLQESVAVATESKSNHWRIKPASEMISKLPMPLKSVKTI